MKLFSVLLVVLVVISLLSFAWPILLVLLVAVGVKLLLGINPELD